MRERVSFLVDDKIRAEVSSLRAHYGLTSSAMIRALIKRAAQQLKGGQPIQLTSPPLANSAGRKTP